MKFQAKPGCEFCDKYGLPVLVVRYATAPETAAAPKTKTLDFNGKDFGDIGGKLHYTRRLLRSGYLYVYDEARNRWEGYYITPDAHLMKFEVSKPLPTAYASNPQPCEESGHREVAGMVTIRDPKNATNVWFGFSDVEWTEKVLNEHASAEYRKKHMQKVDVKQSLAKAKQPNVHPIKELDNKVAEFACDPLRATAVNAFYDSPFKFNPRKLQLAQTLAAADSLRKDAGIIVSLHDPVAVATELAGWMNLRLENYLEANKKDPDYARKIAVSSAILQLRNVVKDHAEHSLIDDAEQTESLERLFTTVSPSRGNLEENFQKTGKPSLHAVQKAQASAWQRYTHRQNGRQQRFDETVVEDFHKEYNAKLNAFIEAEINPLGASHVAWTGSQHMAHAMACNFDPTDIRSGVAYTQTVITFIRGTEGVKPCFAHYEKWLDQNEFKPENVLLRALIYNNDKLAKDVEEATKFDPKALPWDAPISAYKAAMEKMGAGHADRAAVLMGHMMGPLMKVGEKFLDGSSKAVITLLGVYSGKGWKRLNFQGKRKELRAFLARQIIESSGSAMTDSQVKKAVAREIKRAQIRGEKLEGQRGMKWVVLLEPATGQMRTPQTLEEIRFNNFKKTIATNVRLGICTGILQAICLTKAIADEGKALEADKAEAQWRLFAGGLAVAGTISEAIGTVVENATQANLRWAQGLKVVKAGAVLRTAGKALGTIGAAIMAVWDLMKAREEAKKGNTDIANLFRLSAGLGLAVAFCLTFEVGMNAAGAVGVWLGLGGAMPIVVLLVAAFLVTAYFLETRKDNAMQSWLENCIFGIGNSYKDGGLEMKELSKALS